MATTRKIVGVWVDHREAWIVRYDRTGESIVKVDSDVEPRVNSTGGSGQSRVSHHKIEGKRREESHRFYRDILARIGACDDLLLMGPSKAKNELKAMISKHATLSPKLRATLPADHLTDRKIAARVREFFHLGNDLEALAS